VPFRPAEGCVAREMVEPLRSAGAEVRAAPGVQVQ
jgi:hypothetical protein